MTGLHRRGLATALAALVCCAAAVVAGVPNAALAVSGGAVSGRVVPRVELANHPAARPGSNLLVNPGAQAGAASARGWDSVTIPGWQVSSGLPTVVRYGTTHFPGAIGTWPAGPGGQMFAGGAGGTARLRQVVPLRSPAGAPLPGGTHYRLSAWLGGTARSRAAVTVAFLSAAGRVLARQAIGPVGSASARAGLVPRAATGTLPRGTASARVTLVLATSLTDIDGPDSPYVGYDRAVADALRFTVSGPVHQPPPLTPPASRVPPYQHVFLFYFENEGFHSVIGNTRQAPYINGLLPRSSLLSQFFAEEHPSDGNYLALAGGSTFGIPLDDPLEENPQYTIRARNIGDRIDAAHERWKAYLQSAAGPCDNTVHGDYWDDDQPMTYFADVIHRPAYCAAHLVPLQSLQTDLASAATTPNFAWVSPNDCTDMEGCGIRSGDQFLARELGEIMRSPAWRTQRSLAIITFDEDGYNHQRPAQRVPTLVLGSAGVRQGYVSPVRYTHYSLLRTIEGALGLGTLTGNDLWAQPANDIFGPSPVPASPAHSASTAATRHEPHLAAPGLASGQALTAAGRKPARGVARPAARRPQPTAFVVNSGSSSVTPIDLATRQAGRPIGVGKHPLAIAITPGGKTAYVVNSRSDTVTPINTATWRAGPPIPVGRDPQSIAVTPDGKTAYVTNSGSGTVTPISLAKHRPGRAIKVGTAPQAIAVTPDGRTVYVLDWGSAAVTPIDTATGQAGPPIQVGSYPYAITIAPDGSTAYVASYGSDSVTPITVATGRPGRPIPVGQAPDALAVTPDGQKVYAVGGDSDTLTPITTATGHAGSGIPVGYSPAAIAISRSGKTAYVVNTISGTVTPVSTTSGQSSRPIRVGIYSYPTAITLAPSGPISLVVGTYAGRVTLINTRTRHAIAWITVGSYPVAAAIAG
ncbi:MAG TPA: alkaline phosphatase family protein [Streptosporangiaceae bacterium]|nr:alkaline phosphatase family protein [Streptosporangiaceae bacterium]